MSKNAAASSASSSNIHHTPKDAKIIESMLKDVGVTDYEPRVVNQLLEFAYRYAADVVDDAKVYADYARKKQIDAEDIKLAIQLKMENSFSEPPPREMLMEMAKEKNSQALPPLKKSAGLTLPPDRFALLLPNYRLRGGNHREPGVGL